MLCREIQNQIRERAYHRWKKREGKGHGSPETDWLAAEEIVLLERAALRRPSLNQDDVWFDAEKIAGFMNLLKRRLRDRRAGSYLLQLLSSYQDYLTSPEDVDSDNARTQAENILRIYRLGGTFRLLCGDDLIPDDSLQKEFKDLFDNSKRTFETAEHNLFSAAFITDRTGRCVKLITEGGEKSPDLRVSDEGYVECKDLSPADPKNLPKNLQDNLEKASEQVDTAQQENLLSVGGACVDVPLDMTVGKDSWEVLASFLHEGSPLDFILVSSSGLRETSETSGFITSVVLLVRDKKKLRGSFVRWLWDRVHVVDGDGFLVEEW